jgi:hypothetical protein
LPRFHLAADGRDAVFATLFVTSAVVTATLHKALASTAVVAIRG